MGMVHLKNYAASTLQSGIDAAATVLPVTDGSVFNGLLEVAGDWAPAALGRVNSNEYEFVKITGVSGNDITIQRGQEGTTAKSWAAGDFLNLRMTAGALEAFADQDWRRAKDVSGNVVKATRTSDTTCTLPGDFTSLFATRRACRAIQTTEATGLIVSSAFAGGITTVTVKGMVLDAGLEVLDVGLDGKAGPEYPNFPISDATDSTASDVAASSKAAKEAYDKGQAGVDAAAAAAQTASDAGTLAAEAKQTADAAATPSDILAHAPQSLVKARTLPLPSGWSAGECDPPVEVLTYSGNTVTVHAYPTFPLQVAYAYDGRVFLSKVKTDNSTLDLSAASDGVHHVYANLGEDGSFTGFSTTANAPEAGESRVNDAADFFSEAEVKHYEGGSTTSQIRRSYLGWVKKEGGTLTKAHTYSIGKKTTLPVNNGANVALGFEYPRGAPFGSFKHNLVTEIYHNGDWFELPVPENAGYGAKSYIDGLDLETIVGSTRLLDGPFSKFIAVTPVDITGISNSARLRVKAERV